MNHCEYQSLLSQYMDGQLDAQTADSLKQHIPLCPQCRGELEQLTSLRQLCLDLPEKEIPAGLHERIMTRIRSTGTKKDLGWMRRAAIPLAAAVLIFLLGRGIPDSLTNKKTAQDSGRPESMLMAVPEDTKTDENQPTEDTKFTDIAEVPISSAKAGPDNGTAEDSADEAGEGDIRAAGVKTAADTESLGVNQAAAEEKADNSRQFERPSYLKYGIIIALIVGFGFVLIRFLARKK